jgi:hypothetical protein
MAGVACGARKFDLEDANLAFYDDNKKLAASHARKFAESGASPSIGGLTSAGHEHGNKGRAKAGAARLHHPACTIPACAPLARGALKSVSGRLKFAAQVLPSPAVKRLWVRKLSIPTGMGWAPNGLIADRGPLLHADVAMERRALTAIVRAV